MTRILISAIVLSLTLAVPAAALDKSSTKGSATLTKGGATKGGTGDHDRWIDVLSTD